MAKKHNTFGKLALFLLSLLSIPVILVGGGVLGGLAGAWGTPLLFFMALGGIFQGILAPWALGVLVTMVVVLLFIVTVWIVTEHYATQTETMPHALKACKGLHEAPSVTFELENLVEDHQKNQFPAELLEEKEPLYPTITKSSDAAHAVDKTALKDNRHITDLALVATPSLSSQRVSTSPKGNTTPQTPVDSNFDDLPINTPSPQRVFEAEASPTLDSPFQPQKKSKIGDLTQNTPNASSIEVNFGSGNAINELADNPAQEKSSWRFIQSLDEGIIAARPLKTEMPGTPVDLAFDDVSMNTPSPQTFLTPVTHTTSTASRAMQPSNDSFASPFAPLPKKSSVSEIKAYGEEDKENNFLEAALNEANQISTLKTTASPKTPVEFTLSPETTSPKTPVQFQVSPTLSPVNF